MPPGASFLEASKTVAAACSEEDRGRVQLGLWSWDVEPAERDRNVVEPAGAQPPPEVAEPRDHHAGNAQVDVRARLVEHEHVESQAAGRFEAILDAVVEVRRNDGRELGAGAGRPALVGAEL